jgi:hypothetical protein
MAAGDFGREGRASRSARQPFPSASLTRESRASCCGGQRQRLNLALLTFGFIIAAFSITLLNAVILVSGRTSDDRQRRQVFVTGWR